MKLSDKPSENPAHNPLETFGQRRASRPVGVLTEMDREEIASSQAGLVPPWCVGNANVTVSSPASEIPVDHPNAIYATRQYAVSYVR